MARLANTTPQRSRVRLLEVAPRGTLGAGKEPSKGSGGDVALIVKLPSTTQTVGAIEVQDESGNVLYRVDGPVVLSGIGPLRVAHAIYSFASDGGAISTLTPKLTAKIPANAIIWGGVVNSTTAPTGTAGATVAVGTSAGSSTTALLAATVIANLTIDVLTPLVPTLAVPIKLTAAGNITVTIAVHALTAGIIEVFVFYTVAKNA